MGERQVLEEDGVSNPVDRGGGSDAEAQGEDGGEGEEGTTPEGPQAEPRVLDHRLEGCPDPGGAGQSMHGGAFGSRGLPDGAPAEEEARELPPVPDRGSRESDPERSLLKELLQLLEERFLSLPAKHPRQDACGDSR